MNLDSLLTGENASFIDEIYLEWQQDPTSVEEHWASIFAQWESEERVGYAPRSPSPATVFQKRTEASSIDVATAAHRQARIAQLINAYRVHGHHESNIDPLRCENPGHSSARQHVSCLHDMIGARTYTGSSIGVWLADLAHRCLVVAGN